MLQERLEVHLRNMKMVKESALCYSDRYFLGIYLAGWK